MDRGRPAVRRLAEAIRGDVKVNQKHWIGVRPDGGRALPRRRVRARAGGLRERLARARRARDRLLQRRAARQPRALPHRLRRRARRAPASSRSSRSIPASRPSARATTAASAPGSSAATRTPTRRPSSPSRRPPARPTSSRARCRRSCRPTRRTASRSAPPPNIDRCWTCRSMFMQAWGHYGTAWAVVHQQLGVRPHLGRDWLEVVPQVPPGSRAWRARTSASATARSTCSRRTPARATATTTDTRARAGSRRSGSGTRCPRGSTVGVRRARRRAGTDYETRGDEPRPRGVGAARPRAGATRWS